ncbi:MAG: 30S ribosomal protein S1 [Aureliella sp.]
MSSGQGPDSGHEQQASDQPADTAPAANLTPDASEGQAAAQSQAGNAAQASSADPEHAGGTSGKGPAAPASGPLSIDRIRELRASQQNVARQQSQQPRPPQRQPRPAPAAQAPGSQAPTTQAPAAQAAGEQTASQSPAAESAAPAAGTPGAAAPAGGAPAPAGGAQAEGGKRERRRTIGKSRPEPVVDRPPPKLEVPSRRAALPSELQNELESALAGTDLDRMLIGDSMVQVGRELEEGQRVQGRVLKVHGEHVFLSLGGPNEGIISILQFTEPPAVGSTLEVVIRGYLPEEGLYDLSVPGSAVSVSDWEDLKEGEVVEAKVTGSNAGGLECQVGSVRGFIPASQVAEYRVEDLSEFVDQKVLCVITQANPGRGNLVLSRRAVRERERAEKREPRLQELEVGATVEGTVRKLMDFGAFVDIGGLDGLLHISQLSWEKVKHPSEVVQEGQKVQVRVEKIDPQSGKISLSYRSLQDHPWSNIEERFPVGAIVHGTVSRIADFGAFVRLATGVEGLVHLSELAHHRVHRVSNVVQEGQEVDVKVLSVEPERQRMSLSLKAAQQPPEAAAAPQEPEVEEAPRELALPKHRGPLKGGISSRSEGDKFGLKW